MREDGNETGKLKMFACKKTNVNDDLYNEIFLKRKGKKRERRVNQKSGN